MPGDCFTQRGGMTVHSECGDTKKPSIAGGQIDDENELLFSWAASLMNISIVDGESRRRLNKSHGRRCSTVRGEKTTVRA